ncbi:MAG: 2-oxo acid dehydrogenase subunit E2 [Anaerolineales bacterium]|nr:2-oxo acid dehydrogenase subunit E2 [Anaerolineales bacterium]
MATEMIMPKVDMDQETGTIVEWKKQNGETVEQGEIILSIETDKVAIDVEAPAGGILDGISAFAGDVLPIGTTIAWILEPGESLPDKAAESTAAKPEPEPPSSGKSAAAVEATPVARKIAAAEGVDLSALTGTGAGGKITRSDVETALHTPAAGAVPGKVYATPAARRIARENQVDLTRVSGSGPGGRIQAADVDGFAPAVHPPAASREDQVIPMALMRKRIAERLTTSYQTIPHIHFTAEVDMTRFNEARAAMNQKAEKLGQHKISATALLVKMVAFVLRDHPYLNAMLQEDSIVLHGDINIGVAVALPDGLIVPVIPNADLKGLAQLAAELNDLSSRAKSGELVPSEVSRGTFTISNLGPFGVQQFDAIINPPQSAILAVGAMQKKVVALEDNSLAVRPVMAITLSADHRIVDGAVAAHFMADLQLALENPILLFY